MYKNFFREIMFHVKHYNKCEKVSNSCFLKKNVILLIWHNIYNRTRSGSEDSSLKIPYMCVSLFFYKKKRCCMEYKYMKIALEEAKKSLLFGDVPVGAVIVKNGKIIAKSHNKREKNKIATYHAEILVIEKACKKLKTWRLDDCILYVTLEPCLMCYGAIIQSRIPKVVYATSSDKYGFSQKINNDMIKNIKIIDLEKMYGNESKKMLREFFEDKRNKF